MKMFNAIVFFFISLLFLACTKQKNEAGNPQQEVKHDNNLPHFDESNSTKVTWDQLPAELKNAIPMETAKDSKTALQSSASLSAYQYSIGPYGGNGGYSFAMVPPYGGRIYAIAIKSGTLIDRFTVWYMRADGTIYLAGDRGGDGGYYFFNLFSSDEFIYYVAGRSGSFLNRLSIYTNKKSLTYGGTGGNPFSATVPGGRQILGFFGASGQYIDRLGFYVYTL